jgi:small subunit ribosomal protein S11
VTLTDWRHRIVRTISGGMCGLNGHLRGTPEAGTRAATRVGAIALQKGMKHVYVSMKGFGQGREPAFRALVASGIQIKRITDKTPIPHGGCRPRSVRRV